MESQSKFIEILKSIVPPSISLAGEMADILEISVDSAYRRMRCETPITLEEAVKLCFSFDIPLEALNSGMHEVVTFHYQLSYDKNDPLENYIIELQKQMAFIAKKNDAHLYYAAEDIPVFYHFRFKELSRFKFFYWNKSILNTEMKALRYSEFQLSDSEIEKLEQVSSLSSEINTTEIWTEETIKSTLQQIKFYWDAGFFDQLNDALQVCIELSDMIKVIENQAEIGLKKGKNSFTSASFTLYLSDLMIGNNAVYLESFDSNAVFLGYNSFNFIRTRNKDFARQNKRWMENIIKKSTLISLTGEKQRNQFFKKMYKQIEELIEYVKTH